MFDLLDEGGVVLFGGFVVRGVVGGFGGEGEEVALFAEIALTHSNVILLLLKYYYLHHSNND